MGFLGRLFGDGKKQNRDDNGPMPTRALNFQFAMDASNGDRFAHQYKGVVEKNENINLDYSAESLQFVDNFLQRFRDQGLTVDQFAETIFVAGCYVGQVMVKNNQGQWINENEANLPQGIQMMPIVIKLPGGNICDPIGKAFKRFYHGDVDNIRYFYRVFTEPTSS